MTYCHKPIYYIMYFILFPHFHRSNLISIHRKCQNRFVKKKALANLYITHILHEITSFEGVTIRTNN